MSIAAKTLAVLGVETFSGAAMAEDEFSDADLRNRYGRAFADPEKVVVLVTDTNIFTVRELEHIPRFRGRLTGYGIREVVVLPSDLWKMVLPSLHRAPVDLAETEAA